MRRPGRLVLAACALGLFLIWSNSFVAISYLLGADQAPARLDWIGLTVARFLPAALLSAAYCFGAHRAEAVAVVVRHKGRLLLCALMAVPGYNFALYYGQQHGVPAPVASLTTALLPLFVMVLAFFFLRERITGRTLAGFAIAVAGMVVVALARPGERASYGTVVAVTVLAPLSWSIYTVLSKPVTATVRPLLWTYLAISTGGMLLVPLLPYAWDQWSALDVEGWGAVLYLTVPCTVLGFALWTWLLEHLPASTVGLSVFLNPPLTTVSKLTLAVLAPATFVFSVAPLEIGGGAVALLGLLVATGVRGRVR